MVAADEPGADAEPVVCALSPFTSLARTPLLRARRKCWYDAEIQKPVILRDLLSSDDVAKLRRMRAALEASGRTPHMFRDTTEESNHAVCYLHYDGFAQRTEPELMERLLAAMRAHAPSVWPRSTRELRVRCIELHTYQAGGGLFLPSHRDNDSVLTLSARVSEDDAFAGGRFVTYDRGAPVGTFNVMCANGIREQQQDKRPHRIDFIVAGATEPLSVAAPSAEEKTRWLAAVHPTTADAKDALIVGLRQQLAALLPLRDENDALRAAAAARRLRRDSH